MTEVYCYNQQVDSPEIEVALVMASWLESLEKERPKTPKSPSECDFSDVFYERNTDPKIKVNKKNEDMENLSENYDNQTVDAATDQGKEIQKTNVKTEKQTEETTLVNRVVGEVVDCEDNLIDAIKQDRLDAVKKMLDDGCNPDEPVDIEGNRPLHWATFCLKPEIVKLLVEAGADVNLAGKQKSTPLMVTPSIYRRDNVPWSVVHSLIQAGSDINRMNNNSKSTLHMAVQQGNVNLVKILLQYKVDIDIRDAKGRSPIMYAGLLSGANILQYTTQYTFKDVEQIAYMLIKANANVFHSDKFRQNVMHLTIPNMALCDRNKVQEVSPCVIQMLELAGAKIPPKRYLRQWDSFSKSNSQNIQKVIRWFDKQRTMVKPLHHCCRIVIRKTGGQHLKEKLYQITIPDKIREYLLLPELDDLMDRLCSQNYAQ